MEAALLADGDLGARAPRGREEIDHVRRARGEALAEHAQDPFVGDARHARPSASRRRSSFQKRSRPDDEHARLDEDRGLEVVALRDLGEQPRAEDAHLHGHAVEAEVRALALGRREPHQELAADAPDRRRRDAAPDHEADARHPPPGEERDAEEGRRGARVRTRRYSFVGEWRSASRPSTSPPTSAVIDERDHDDARLVLREPLAPLVVERGVLDQGVRDVDADEVREQEQAEHRTPAEVAQRVDQARVPADGPRRAPPSPRDRALGRPRRILHVQPQRDRPDRHEDGGHEERARDAERRVLHEERDRHGDAGCRGSRGPCRAPRPSRAGAAARPRAAARCRT